MDDQIITYVRESAARGVPAQVTRQQLLSVGWDPSLVNHAINSVYPAEPLNNIASSVSQSINDNRGKWAIALVIMLFFTVSSVVIGIIVFASSPSRSLSRVSDSIASSEHSSLVTLPNTNYQTYSNDEFSFRLTIPTDWTYREYSRSKYGEYRVAFGLKKNLPIDYFGDGDFVWLRVFPVSARQKYDPFIAESKKSGVRNYNLNGLSAFDTGSYVGVYNNRYAAEIHPPTMIDSDGSEYYDESARRIISSFRFIN